MINYILNNPIECEEEPVVIINDNFEICLEAYDYIQSCKSLKQAYEECKDAEYYNYLFSIIICNEDYDYYTFKYTKIKEYSKTHSIDSSKYSHRYDWFVEWKKWILSELPWEVMSEKLLKIGFIKEENNEI